jgi:MOSC domain-containing protein YiiM
MLNPSITIAIVNNCIQLFIMMRILSVNVSHPQPIILGGQRMLTGIFKKPVEGPVRVSRLRVEGDAQADLNVHGGLDKAVYAYSHEHYAFWEKHMGVEPYPMGQFGENFTTIGLLEDEVFIGDILRAGSAVLQVAQPRQPCAKLGTIMDSMSFICDFQKSLRVGFYFRVVEEGKVARDDLIEIVERDNAAVTVAEFASLFHLKQYDETLARRVLQIESLMGKYRVKVREMLTGKMDEE